MTAVPTALTRLSPKKNQRLIRAERTPISRTLVLRKALELMARGSWDLAQDQLGRALAAPLPAHARGELEELARRCEAAYTRPGR
jgi:hypothetical protein